MHPSRLRRRDRGRRLLRHLRACARTAPAAAAAPAASAAEAAPAGGPSEPASGPATAATHGPGGGAPDSGSGATRRGAPPRPAPPPGAPGRARRDDGSGRVRRDRAEPAADPAEAVMAEAMVSESSRYCAVCDAAVGRGRDNRPGRTEGFCPQCGTRFSFTPTLRSGDLVAGQYEVLGALAHGGLAGSTSPGTAGPRPLGGAEGAAQHGDAAAPRGRRRRAEASSPSSCTRASCGIYNVVTGADGATYIVMEYVGRRGSRRCATRRRADGRPEAGAGLRAGGPARAVPHARARACSTATSSRTTSCRPSTDVTLIDLGASPQWTTRAGTCGAPSATRHGRSPPTARGPRSPPTSTPSADARGAGRDVQLPPLDAPPAPARATPPRSPTSRCGACWPAPPTPTRPGGSSRSTRWPTR